MVDSSVTDSLIEEFRGKERQWSAELLRLQKALLRLAFNHYGRDQVLDEKLDLFRSNVRNNREFDRGALIEEIIGIVLKLDHEQQTHDIAATADRAAALEHLLDRMAIPESALPSVNTIRDKLRHNSQQGDVLKLINETADILSQALNEATGVTSAKRSSTEDYIHAQASLLKLLQRLSVPTQLQEHFTGVQASLSEKLVAPEELDKTLDAIIDLITRIQLQMQHEVDEVERFLKHVIRRLQTLDAHLETNRELNSARLTDSNSLSSQVNDTMMEIRSEVSECQELNTLKQQIDAHLAHLQSSFSNFLDVEKERNAASEENSDLLKDKLLDLENETISLRQAILEENKRALTDVLTGVANRLAYEERITAEISRCKRSQTPLSLMVIDIDHFKNVNDRYGHTAGDRVLSNIASMLSGQIRETDFFARYGGEEFVLILPDTDLDATMGVANKLREAVSRCRFHYRNETITLTISTGAALHRDEDSAEDLFVRADTTLYYAKQNGRNRCCSENDLLLNISD